MKITDTKDREIKRDARTGIFYYRGTPVRGSKSIFRSLGVRSFGAAVSAKKDLLLRLRGVDFSQRDITFSAYVRNIFLPDRKRKAKKTFETALGSVRVMTPFFEHYPMRSITDRSWDEYKQWHAQMYPTRQLANDRKQLIMMLNRLHREGHIQKLPNLEIPKYEVESRRVFSEAEVKRLFEVAPEHYQGFILLMYKMGFRPGEVLSLTWDRVDFAKETITLRDQDTKTRTGRTVRINKECLNWLEGWKLKSDSEFVFKSRGRNSALNRINKTWGKLCELAKIEAPNTPYCLRHTFLTEAAKRVRTGDLSLVLVCQYAGTSVKMLTEHYLHIDGEDTKGVSEIMNFGGAF
jgi:integrase